MSDENMQNEEVELDEDLTEILDELLENSDTLDELENDPTISEEDLHEISMLKKLAYAYKAGGHSRKLKKHVDNALAPGGSWNDLAKGAVANKLLQRRERGKGLLRRSFERDKEKKSKMNEESIAAATLKPGSRTEADPKSKIEFMQRTLGAMNGMKKEDLSKWYEQAMALIGKEASSLPSGASSDANQSSVDMKTGKGPKTRDAMPKLSVREDVEEMFVGEELSEEFRDKATTLFEAAVNAKLTVEIAKLEEEYEARLDEELTSIVEETEKNLDTYLNYVVERWMDENRVAIESTLRSEITEEFIGGLKNLFAEHYIDVPEEKIDVVESLTAKVEELEEQLHEAISVNKELTEAVIESERHEVFEELSEGLTMAQSEKFAALAEGIEFDGDLDVYRTKLSVVKEKYFAQKTHSSNIEEETFEGETLTESTVTVDPTVNRYVQAISRTIKK